MFLKLFCRFRFKVVFQEFQLGFLIQLHFNYQEIQISCELIKSYDYFGLRLDHLLRIPSCHLFASEGIQMAESVIDSLGIQKSSFVEGSSSVAFNCAAKSFWSKWIFKTIFIRNTKFLSLGYIRSYFDR